jgi:uncharacterized protein YbjT (DUF2867 family)
MVILVVGSTGMVGSEVCRQLRAAGQPVRAMVRPTSDPAKVAALRDLGAEILQADLSDPVSLAAACKGVQAVITTASAMPFSYVPDVNTPQITDQEGMIGLIDAARAAGVPQFVYTSFSGNIDLDCPLRNAKRAVEQHLQESGLTYTILRPSCFMEVWLGPAFGFDYPNAKATIFGTGARPLSWIAYRDVARFAVASLDNPAARNAILEMGGPQALSPEEAVHIFERVGGRPFEVQHVPEDALRAQWQAATDPMQKSAAALMMCVAQGDPIDMAGTLKAFPLQLTSVEDYAKSVLTPA